MRRYLIFIFCCLITNGCAHRTSSVVLQDKTDIGERGSFAMEIYMARASFSLKEYERYKINNKRILYYECGRISGNSNIPYSSGIIDDININSLSAIESLAIKIPANIRFPSEGEVSSGFSRGKFYFSANINGRKIKFKTNFDKIAEGGGRYSKILLSIVKKVRGLLNINPCGNRMFYSIGKEN